MESPTCRLAERTCCQSSDMLSADNGFQKRLMRVPNQFFTARFDWLGGQFAFSTLRYDKVHRKRFLLGTLQKPIVLFAAVCRKLEMPYHSFLISSCQWMRSERTYGYTWKNGYMLRRYPIRIGMEYSPATGAAYLEVWLHPIILNRGLRTEYLRYF